MFEAFAFLKGLKTYENDNNFSEFIPEKFRFLREIFTSVWILKNLGSDYPYQILKLGASSITHEIFYTRHILKLCYFVH